MARNNMFVINVMLKKLIQSLWLKFRPIPRRFYRWGTVGLSIYDDRSQLERVCDRIDDFMAEWNKRIYRKDRSIWHSWYEPSIKRWIHGISDIKEIERKKGWNYMDFSDIEKEADFQHKEGLKKDKERAKEYLRKSIREIKQGRSFVKETQDRIRQNQYKVGRVETFN